MAIVTVPRDSKLKLQLDGGVDGNGREIVKSKTFSNVKTDAVDDTVYTVANSLTSLQNLPLISVTRINEVELQQSI